MLEHDEDAFLEEYGAFWLAWQGFQASGRGAVLVPFDAAAHRPATERLVYCPLSELRLAAARDGRLNDVENEYSILLDYDPERHAVVAFLRQGTGVPPSLVWFRSRWGLTPRAAFERSACS